MKSLDQIEHAHGLIESVTSGDIESLKADPDELPVWMTVKSVLCWVLDHEFGSVLQGNLNNIEAMMKGESIKMVYVPAPEVMGGNGHSKKPEAHEAQPEPKPISRKLEKAEVEKLHLAMRAHLDMIETTTMRAGRQTADIMSTSQVITGTLYPSAAPFIFPIQGEKVVENLIKEMSAMSEEVNEWFATMKDLAGQYSGLWQAVKVFFDSLDAPQG